MHISIYKKIVSLLGMVLISIAAMAQVKNTRYFPDGKPGEIDYILDHKKVSDGVILATRQGTGNDAVLMKIDKNGNVVWSCANKAVSSAMSSFYYFNIEVFSDGYIYGLSSQTNSLSKQFNTLWKVNSKTGEVAWQRLLYAGNTYNFTADFADYDQNTFLVAYIYQSEPVIAVFSKSTGDTLKTKRFPQGPNSVQIAVDVNKSIYFAQNDTITKFSAGNFNFPAWKRVYKEWSKTLDAIHDLYIDTEDNLFAFGRNGGSFGAGNGIIVKVNKASGLQDWYAGAGGGEVVISGFADYNGYLYANYQHAFVGGGSYYFTSGKVHKKTGEVAWNSYLSNTRLGSPQGHSGGGESARAIDVDCKGNVFLTGYYGDANYGPEAWGIMKVKDSDGTKEFDLTITLDSAKFDDLSTGQVIYTFGDTVIVLGQLQNPGTNTSSPYFVSISASTGNIIKRNTFGTESHLLSRTIKITDQKDSVYVLKQQGRYVILEKYDNKHKVFWSKTLYADKFLQAGQLKVLDNAVYLTAFETGSDSFDNKKTAKTKRLLVYKFKSSTGEMLDADTANFNSEVVAPFELEADKNAAFIFYYRDKKTCLIKWENSILSTEKYIENAGQNMDFEGDINIAINKNASELLYLGKTDIYAINKSTLAKTSVFKHKAPVNIYDNIFVNDTALFITGSDTLANQYIGAIKAANMSLQWENKYLANGALYKIVMDNSYNLYVAGVSKNITTIHQVLLAKGKTGWTYWEDTSWFPVSIPYDFAINKKMNYLVYAGANKRSSSITDVSYRILGLNGKNVTNYFSQDQQNYISRLNTIAVLQDSLWIGGSHNRSGYPKQGVIYSVYQSYVNTCNNSFATIYKNACYSYASLSGKYNWSVSGTYLDTIKNAAGCDSILVMHIKILSTYNTIAKNACGSYQSPSGKFIWNASGIYKDTLENTNGCDSVITVNLTVDQIDTVINQSAGTLTANILNAQYQWLDCGNGYAIIPGETNRTFTPGVTGSYAVKITNGACIDTSACYTVNVVSVAEEQPLEHLVIYPNPTLSILNVEGLNDSYYYTLTDVLGKQIMHGMTTDASIYISNVMPGAYILKIESGKAVKNFRIIKL